MNDQVTQRYLVPMRSKHGIYVVYWIQHDQRPAGWNHRQAPDLPNLRSQLADQADVIRRTGAAEVAVYVLDVSRPQQ
jgi:hypothetical protein